MQTGASSKKPAELRLPYWIDGEGKQSGPVKPAALGDVVFADFRLVPQSLVGALGRSSAEVF